MKRTYTKIYSRILLLAVIMLMSFTMVATPNIQKGDSTYFHLGKTKKERNVLKTFHVNLPVIKPYPISSAKTAANYPVADDKVLSNVQVYPNPVSDQINLKYSLSRDAIVTIKIMDVLGNEVLVLFSQKVEHGDKIYASGISKMKSGFYFVRVVVGTESVIKRISIL